jgi:ribosomal protein L37AE/L43A
MGLRSRLSRKNRKRQKNRARARRQEALKNAALLCLDCASVLARDEETDLDIWNCATCGKTFLRVGPQWITELDTITSVEHEFAVAEFLRKAA